jgi:hypothetical protein
MREIMYFPSSIQLQPTIGILETKTHKLIILMLNIDKVNKQKAHCAKAFKMNKNMHL